MKRILHISPDFNYSCGRSKSVFLYLKHFEKRDGYEMHFITNGGDSLERLKEVTSIKFGQLKFSSGFKNVFYKRKFYNDLKEYLIGNKINIIHTHHRFPEMVAAKIGRELNIKTITTNHSFVKGFKKLSFKSDKIISVSNTITSHLVKDFNINPERIITLYNPVEKFPEINPEEGINLKEELGINPVQKILLFPGRISFVKGVDILLEAVKILIQQRNDITLIICGSFDDTSLQKRIKQTGNVILLKPQQNIYSFYSAADIVTVPSRTDPFPFVMLEAGMFKKPFIGGNTGGIAEFIEDGVNGLLVDPESPHQLAEKIVYLLNNKDFAKKLGENLFNKVRVKCDYNNYFEKVEEIYNTL